MLALTPYNSLRTPWLLGIKERLGLVMYTVAVAAGETEAKMVSSVLHMFYRMVYV